MPHQDACIMPRCAVGTPCPPAFRHVLMAPTYPGAIHCRQYALLAFHLSGQAACPVLGHFMLSHTARFAI